MKILSYAVSLALLIALPALAVDFAAMQTSLKVQQKILDTIIDSDSAFSVDVNSEGIYLSGLGAVITVKISEEWTSSFLTGFKDYPALQEQLSKTYAEDALKDAAKKLEDAIKESQTLEKSRPKKEIEQQIVFVEQEREKIQQKLEEPAPVVEEMELRRKEHELQRVDVELQEELNRLEESVQVLEAAIEASKNAIIVTAPPAPSRSAEAESSDEVVINLKASVKEKKERSATRTEDIDRMVAKLKTYMADFGPAIDLDRNEMLLLRTEFTPVGGYGKSEICYEISVSGDDLSKLRTGKMVRDKFLSNIKVETCGAGKTIPKDIVIMKNILNTAFENEINSDYSFHFVNRNDFWESYIPGYGAVFFRKYNPGLSVIKMSVDDEDNDFVVLSEGKSGESVVIGDKINKTGKSLSQLENELIELLVNYSQSLKSLQKGENIVVAVKMREGLIKQKERMMVIKLNTADINRYSPQELKKRIEVVKI